MKKRTKVLLLLLSAALLVVASVMGTMAYLTSKDEVTNTFTVGKVQIELDEAKVNQDGEPLDANGSKVSLADAVRTSSNAYKLIPGKAYTKDPTVTVKAPSEKAYVYMTVIVNGYDNLTAALPNKEDTASYYSGTTFLLQNLCDWTPNSPWVYCGCKVSGTSAEYRFAFDSNTSDSTVNALDEVASDKKLPALFSTITVPGKHITNDNIEKLKNVEIVVNAYAVQEATFDDYNAAWKAGFGDETEQYDLTN